MSIGLRPVKGIFGCQRWSEAFLKPCQAKDTASPNVTIIGGRILIAVLVKISYNKSQIKRHIQREKSGI